MTEYTKNSELSQISAQDTRNFPLTSGQKGLWFLHQFDSSSDCYNIPLTFTISKEVTSELLRQCIDIFISRHSSMRSTFHIVDGEPVRRVHQNINYAYQEYDVCALSKDELRKRVREISAVPFDLINGPLVRVYLLDGYENQSILLLNFHHIIFDGTSLKILTEEFELIYRALVNQLELPPENVIDFEQFQSWQTNWLLNEEAAESRAYWLDKFSGELPTLPLPLKTDNSGTSIHGETIHFQIPETLMNGVRNLAKASQCSEYFVWLMLYFCFLSRYTAEKDIIVGTPARGRPDADFDSVVGYFVNLMPVRNQIDQSESFTALLARTKNDFYEDLMNADYPLSELIKDLGLENRRGDEPLFQTSFIWSAVEHLKGQPDNLMGLTLFPLIQESGEQSLSLEILAEGNKLEGVFKYRQNLFSDKTMSDMQQHFLAFAQVLLKQSEQALFTVDFLSDKEKSYLVNDLNVLRNEDVVDELGSIQKVFERQVEATPESIAVKFGEDRLTYVELNNRANQLAHYLINQGVQSETIVAICFERSIEMIISILAVLKSGGAYLPIDAKLPTIRMNYLLEDSQANYILCQQSSFNLFTENYQVINIEDPAITDEIKDCPKSNPLVEAVTANSLAYVIYTSGSTGQPKGVLQQHKTIVNLVKHQQLSEPLLTLQFAPISFDVSIQEIATTLLTGGCLVLINQQDKDNLQRLPQLIFNQSIQRLFVPPVVANLLAEIINQQHIELPELKEIIVAGEALYISEALFQFLSAHQHCQLYNHYGPTETHVATLATIKIKDCLPAGSQPIGRPLTNAAVYVLDSSKNLLPYGATGELYVAGSGLARGYLNDPKRTVECFIDNPFEQNSLKKLYRTGDLVRYLENGELEFVGRIDQQVKIRGFRIELSEVEAQLAKLQEVSLATVLVKENNTKEKHLVAYVVASSQLSEAKLIEKLRLKMQQNLPAYMVPTVFVLLENMPFNANGKIDRSALPEVDSNSFSVEYVAPENSIERELCQIWAQLLNISANNISRNHNFFELGGHSLLVVKLINEIKNCYALELDYQQVFNHSKLSELSESIGLILSKNKLEESLLQLDSEQVEEAEW